MKVLQLCLRIPYPANDGGNIAMFNMAQAMKINNCEVHIAALNTTKHFVNVDELPIDFVNDFHFQSVPIVNKVTAAGAFINLFSKQSYNVSRFISLDFETLLISILKINNFDIVVCESLFMAPYVNVIKKYSTAKCILRAHNVETLVWERLAKGEKNIAKKWYINLLAKKLKRYEQSAFNLFDGIIAFTQEDKILLQQMGCKVDIEIIPICIDTKKFDIKFDTGQKIKLFHLGGMDWRPNLEAIQWWLQNVYPLCKKEMPQIELHLAGKHMPKDIFDMADNRTLFVYNKIVTVKEFMADKQIMIVPLLSGGGMRVKIIEGLAAGRVVISTSIGAEGIAAIPEKEILIANTPQEFIVQLNSIVDDKLRMQNISKAAKEKADKLYDVNACGAQVKLFFQKIIVNTSK